MKKLLLTGASGFLGWNICKTAIQDWEIHGIINSAQFDFPGVALHRCNLSDEKGIRALFDRTVPDAVIHTAAISDPNYCQEHPEESYLTNVTATEILAKLCAEKQIPFVFTSTDLVFDGKKGNYTESDPVNPISKYGEQKVEAENSIRKIYPGAAICRMPIMVGAAGENKKGYLQLFLEKAAKGESFKLFTDEFRTPLGGVSAATGLLHAVSNFSGTYHLGGKERMSRYELGKKIAEVFEISTGLTPLKQADIKMAAPRPADVSFDSTKAYCAGFNPYTISEELHLLREQGWVKM